jgi:hypothetical protein
MRDGCSDGGGHGFFATDDMPCCITLPASKPVVVGGRNCSRLGERPKSPADYVYDPLFASAVDGAATLELGIAVLHRFDLADVPARGHLRQRDE